MAWWEGLRMQYLTKRCVLTPLLLFPLLDTSSVGVRVWGSECQQRRKRLVLLRKVRLPIGVWKSTTTDLFEPFHDITKRCACSRKQGGPSKNDCERCWNIMNSYYCVISWSLKTDSIEQLFMFIINSPMTEQNPFFIRGQVITNNNEYRSRIWKWL